MNCSKLRRSLFIDDDTLINIFHQRLVTQNEIFEEFEFFSDAKKALLFLEKNAPYPDRFPDIIFLDIDMPGMNGWDFIDEFANFNLSKFPIIILLTASKRSEDITRANLSNMVYKLWHKPLHLDAIRNLKKDFVLG